ncbi:DUF29 domain-containing protein [Microcystis aeruginosa CS-564/01]|uniref:DUF29 domain-containing protein n=1 Tax=Microcystis aeruginosa TaxID=1126 RepID=UPI00232DECAD|nr:DUF29 domain-containing protein [Microcystis aeruginosa]MDB9424004.1 DUF29 domain-containing protein [Microcystis aeruginosa CS-564/01]
MAKIINLESQNKLKILYQADFNLWLEETANFLRQGKWEQLDRENLIEEIEAMVRSEKRALVSLLTRLFEHLLKLTYWTAEQEYNYRHWRGEILNFRKQIKKELQASPSLTPYLSQIQDECYQDAREIVAELSSLPLETFPVQGFGNLEQVLDEQWFPKSPI